MYTTSQSRAYSPRVTIHKQIYFYIVWPDGCVPRIKAYDSVSARGNIEVYQEMDSYATNSYACWELCARGPRVLVKGDARNCWLVTLSVSGLRVSSACTVLWLIIPSVPYYFSQYCWYAASSSPFVTSCWFYAQRCLIHQGMVDPGLSDVRLLESSFFRSCIAGGIHADLFRKVFSGVKPNIGLWESDLFGFTSKAHASTQGTRRHPGFNWG